MEKAGNFWLLRCLLICVTGLHPTSRHVEHQSETKSPMKIASIEGSHLISLDLQEALMMVRLLQAARLHPATAQEAQSSGDVLRFLDDLSTSLMRNLSRPEIHSGVIRPREKNQKNSFDIG